MSETVEQTDAWFRARIDEVATRLIVDGASRELAEALVRLSEQAGAAGFPDAGRMASGVAERMNAGAGADSLGDELARLRQALEGDSRRSVQQPGTPAPDASVSLAQDPELIRDFIVESQEHLANIETGMLVLEQAPDDAEAIHAVFRAFHTIKGLAGFMEFAEIQEVAHEVETLLDMARNSKLAITPGVVDVVLASADYLKQAVAAVETDTAGRNADADHVRTALLVRIRAAMIVEKTPGENTPGENTPAETPALPQSEATASAAPAAAIKDHANAKADAFSIRIDTGKLDYLMDMVGEMVIAQSLIRHNPNLVLVEDSRLQGDLSQLARITGEVQRTAMSMRMIPIGHVFRRTARLVRDLARKAGKQVELETRGDDTELDKTIAEELSDPLMHMVRNSIDHGVEPAEARVAAGKSATAHLRLAAYHQGGQIVVEIADDGRGLEREKILKRARQKGLVADGVQLSEKEMFHLIFEPGFSTAERVTDISGRGVGMDVVRKHVQKLRGRIEVRSEAGRGTTFFLKLPLTLAIIEGLVVVVGSHRYIVPIFAVREMFRPASGAVSTVGGRDEMVQVRRRLLPVVRLHRRFGVQPRSEDPCEGLLVVAESESRSFCMLVDDLAGKQEVVIKSLGESLKNIAGIAGGAILGDGRVGLILDMEGVFRGARRD